MLKVKTVISVTTDRQKGGIANALVRLGRALKLAGYRHMVILPEEASIAPELRKEEQVTVKSFPLFWLKFHLWTGFIFCPSVRAELPNTSALLVHNASLIKPISHLGRPHFFINHSGKLRHLQKAEHILFLTQSAKKRAEHHFQALGMATEKYPACSIMPHGFEWPEKGPSKRKPARIVKIIAAGRFVAKKGFSDLIEAAAILQKQSTACRIEIYGSGPLAPAYKQEIERAALENISIQGWAEDLSAVFAEADLFCLPSHEEPFGLILGEAMGMGLPVIATLTDGPSDILGAKGSAKDATLAYGGLLVETASPDKLAKAIAFMVKNSDIRRQAGQAGARHIRTHYNLEKQAERLKKILASAQR